MLKTLNTYVSINRAIQGGINPAELVNLAMAALFGAVGVGALVAQ